jgi:hypothetical protein
MYDLASKYIFAFKDSPIKLLLLLMEEYVNGAELQIRRIDRTRKMVHKEFQSLMEIKNVDRPNYRNRHLRIFCDSHFYFICIGQVSKCLERLCAELKNENLYKINSEFQKIFKQVSKR